MFLSALPIFWLVLAVVLGIIEAFSVQLLVVWFAVGAVAAVIPAAFLAPLWVQILVFVSVSALMLILTRPFVNKIRARHPVHTNADSVIGTIGVVIQDVDSLSGRVMVSGLDWSARSDVAIPKDVKVIIKSIDGVKLIVEPAESYVVQ